VPDAQANADAFDRKLIAPMILGAVLNPLNSSMIAVALVPIGAYFGAPPSRTAWLVSGLYVATAIGQPLVGRLVDAYGPRRLFLAGTALTGLAGLLGALAPNLPTLVASRVLLGIGTCAGYPAAMFLLRAESRHTGADNPSGVLSALAVTTQVTAVVGPSLGGGLIDLGGWRTIFAVNIPLSLAAIAVGHRRLPEIELPPREPRAPGVHLNLPLLATYGRNLLTFLVSYSYLYGYTQWLEEGRGLSASVAGLVLIPMFGVAIGVVALTGRSRAVRGKLLVGSGCQLIACALLLLAGARSPVWLLLLVATVVGVPQGLNSLANQAALYHQADPARIGGAAGLLRTFTYLGAIGSSVATGAFFGAHADTVGLHRLAWFALAASALLLLASVADPSLRVLPGKAARERVAG
jgi:predicted MFS family arabinose efflux permease